MISYFLEFFSIILGQFSKDLCDFVNKFLSNFQRQFLETTFSLTQTSTPVR